MPKDKSSRALGSRKDKNYTYKPYSSTHGKGLEMTEGDISNNPAETNEWDNATCPICMDFPHNAVLLLCTSHEKGCRPYICDTSHRHSNCLDQYQKAYFGTRKIHSYRELTSRSATLDSTEGMIVRRSEAIGGDSTRSTQRSGRNRASPSINGVDEFGEVQVCDLESVAVDEGGGMKDSAVSEYSRGSSSIIVHGDLKGLVCPLCRGKVHGLQVVDEARRYLNRKARSCAQESCLFIGNYEELRIHARRQHPFARPSAIDPAREQNWQRMERQRDLGDVFSTIRSAMPGATVIGDIAFEDDLEDDDMDFPGDDGHWWTVFMLFQFFGPATSFGRARGISSHSGAHSYGLRRSGRARLGESWHGNGIDPSNDPSGGIDAGDHATESSQQQQRSSHVPQVDMN